MWWAGGLIRVRVCIARCTKLTAIQNRWGDDTHILLRVGTTVISHSNHNTSIHTSWWGPVQRQQQGVSPIPLPQQHCCSTAETAYPKNSCHIMSLSLSCCVLHRRQQTAAVRHTGIRPHKGERTSKSLLCFSCSNNINTAVAGATAASLNACMPSPPSCSLSTSDSRHTGQPTPREAVAQKPQRCLRRNKSRQRRD